MAYIARDNEDPYNKYAQQAGGGQGIVGQAAVGSGAGAMPGPANSMAPTNSGSHFVNLQRYLQGNPTIDMGDSVDKYTQTLVDQDRKSTDAGIAPVKRYTDITTTPSSPYSLSDLSHDADIISGPFDDPRSNWMRTQAINRVTGNTGSVTPPKYTYSTPTDVSAGLGQLDNPFTGSTPGHPGLMGKIANSPSNYTPGMEALDIGIGKASGFSTSGAAKKLQGAISDDQGRSDQANSYAQAVADAQKAYIAGAGNFTHGVLSDPGNSGLGAGDDVRLSKLAKILGLPLNLPQTDMDPGPASGNPTTLDWVRRDWPDLNLEKLMHTPGAIPGDEAKQMWDEWKRKNNYTG